MPFYVPLSLTRPGSSLEELSHSRALGVARGQRVTRERGVMGRKKRHERKLYNVSDLAIGGKRKSDPGSYVRAFRVGVNIRVN